MKTNTQVFRTVSLLFADILTYIKQAHSYRILEQKSHKQYNSQHTWLVIRNAHPKWNTVKIRAASDKILLPKNHPFEQIWIVGDLQAETGALRL